MTQREAEQLARGLRSAQRYGLRAHPGRTKDGQAVYAVLSRSQTRSSGIPTYHLLTVTGGRVVCDCPAGLRGWVCAHRAAVHQFLKGA